jgi:hypothetical protein
MTKEERTAEWLRVTMALNALNIDFADVLDAKDRGTVVITNETYGKVVEYLITRKQELA